MLIFDIFHINFFVDHLINSFYNKKRRWWLFIILHRKIYQKLIEWKNSSSVGKAILIKGARRVGKSFIAEEFAKNEYKSYILIDFSSQMDGTLQIFKKYGNKYNLDDFFNQLSLLYATPLYNRESVLVFDEIQDIQRQGN